MNPIRSQFLLTLAVIFWVSACGKQAPQTDKPVLHLFADAELIHAEGVLAPSEDGSPIHSQLTYPHDDTLWAESWQGKQTLRFDSTEEGDLRGSLFMMHDELQPEFRLQVNNWLEADAPETWSGIVFWMGKNNKQAVGVRWKAQKYKQLVQVQIFKYDFPHVRSLVQQTFPFQNSHWAESRLIVKENRVTLTFDGNPPLECEIQPSWNIGNLFGFFQGLGSGYFADLSIESGNQTFQYQELFDRWNQEMVNTTRKVLLEMTPTPDDFVGYKIPVRRMAIADDWRISVPVYCPSELSFRLTIPEQATLHTSYGVLPPFSLSKTTAEFRVVAKNKQRETVIFSETVTPAEENLNSVRYHDVHLPLDDWAGQEIELAFQIVRKQGDEPLVACWSEPIIGKKKPNPKPLNVLLILLDTLRADRVGVYGNQRDLTPYIDRLASTGTTFLQTVSQAPWTVPSHASFFTGLYPSETQCDFSGNAGNRLQEGYLTWAEYLQREGYSTAAFTSGMAIRGNVGLNQGFDTYQDVMYDAAYGIETLYERYRNWLDEHQGEPWFVFYHTYAVHFPYKHEQFIDYRKITRSWEDQRQMDLDTYDSGVRFVDEWVGILLRDLQQRKLMDSTLLIIASDHGEELGERGMPRPAHHGHTLYDELLLVPLIFHLPDQIPQGVKIAKQVRLLDMLPTVLDILNIQPPVLTHGMSLKNLMMGKPEPERIAFSEGMTYGVAQKSLRTKDFKYIFVPDPNKTLDDTPTGIPVPTPEMEQLYDLQQDPGEKENRASSQNAKLLEVQNLKNIIQETFFDPKIFNDGSQVLEPPILSPRIMEELQKLGYAAK